MLPPVAGGSKGKNLVNPYISLPLRLSRLPLQLPPLSPQLSVLATLLIVTIVHLLKQLTLLLE
jgi:hypothetical protein